MTPPELIPHRNAPNPSLQGLPDDLRVRLFENYITHPPDLLTLRAVCPLFQAEIDNLVGILNLISFDDFDNRRKPEHRQFVSNIALRHIRIESAEKSNLEDIVSLPYKLESIILNGAASSDFVSQILKTCKNLVKLQVEADITSHILRPTNNRRTILPVLRKLSYNTGHTMPVPKSSRRKFFETGILNSVEFLRSILSPRLTSLEFRLFPSVPLDILNVIQGIFEFLRVHPGLKNVDISISPEYIDDVSGDEENIFDLERQDQDDEERRNKLEKVMEEIENGQNLTLKTLKLTWALEDESDLMLKYLKIFRNLKNFGLRLTKRYFWSQISPTLATNSSTLTTICIQCIFKSSVDFSNFGDCSHLKSISVHHQNYPSRSRIYLNNIPMGLNLLPKLEVVIVDGLIVSGPDMEVLTGWDLKVLGLRGVVAVDYFENGVNVNEDPDGNGVNVGMGQDVHGDGLPEPGQVGNQNGNLTGVTYSSFKNLMRNRSLDALLVDMDSIAVTTMDDGMDILKMRDLVSGQFQSLFLDISDWDSNEGGSTSDGRGTGSGRLDDDGHGRPATWSAGGHDPNDSGHSKSPSIPYWRTSFLGFSVHFPLLP